MKTLRLFALAASLLIVACAPSPSSSSSQGSFSSGDSSSALQEFTLAQLAEYNGDNGSPAYIAVNGTVYDVTNAENWDNGWHKGNHYAGTDCTAAFADSPHSASILSNLPIVGTLI